MVYHCGEITVRFMVASKPMNYWIIYSKRECFLSL